MLKIFLMFSGQIEYNLSFDEISEQTNSTKFGMLKVYAIFVFFKKCKKKKKKREKLKTRNQDLKSSFFFHCCQKFFVKRIEIIFIFRAGMKDLFFFAQINFFSINYYLYYNYNFVFFFFFAQN